MARATITATASSEKRFWLASLIASRQSRWCILIVLALALLPPEKGLGVNLCMMHRVTGAPCPGCGMLRCGSNLVRGNFRRAFDFNPFGFVLYPVLFGLVCLSLLPDAVRGAFAQRLMLWQRALNIANLTFWIALFVFGMARWAAVMGGLMSFPPNWLGQA